MGKDVDQPTARWLTRAQVAELLGVADQEVAKMDGQQLHPLRAPDRVWRYPPSEVRALLVPGSGEITGSVAAQVFARFEANEPLAKIVIATEQLPATVLELRSQYAELAEGFVVPRQTAEDLSQIVGARVRCAAELVVAMRNALDEASGCGQILDRETGQYRRVEFRDEEPK